MRSHVVLRYCMLLLASNEDLLKDDLEEERNWNTRWSRHQSIQTQPSSRESMNGCPSVVGVFRFAFFFHQTLQKTAFNVVSVMERRRGGVLFVSVPRRSAGTCYKVNLGGIILRPAGFKYTLMLQLFISCILLRSDLIIASMFTPIQPD